MEEYAEAAADYRQLADNHRASHLAPVALYNASAGLEESGDTEAAVEALETLLSRYRDENAPEVPRALFSLGRIHEQQGEYQTAAEHYRDLVDSYGNSSWTSLARDRIIWLTTQGQIESESGQG
jgi:tetratricopeptide (TPR) repeat protein